MTRVSSHLRVVPNMTFDSLRNTRILNSRGDECRRYSVVLYTRYSEEVGRKFS